MAHNPDTRWWHHAACHGTPDHLWHGTDTPGTQEGTRTRTAQAKKICATCPVQPQCLEDAMTIESSGVWHSYRSGIRGGLTARERHTLETNRRREQKSIA